mgnify:CR=1 FL=1
MIEVYKILHDFYDSNITPSLIRNLDNRTRGNFFKLKVNRCRYDVCKFAFCNRVTNGWNYLPDKVVASISLNMFKNNLDNFWKDDEFYYNYEADVAF